MTQLANYATGDVVTISAATSIDEAIQLLQQHRIRHLPVVRDGVPVGMVSEGDVLATVGGLLCEERVSDFDATVPYAGPAVVEQIMTTGVVTLSPEESFTAAAHLMLERRIAAVVLVSDKKIVGIVTETDILRQFFAQHAVVPDSCRRQTVAKHMKTELVTATPTDNVFALIRNMAKQIRHVPVVEDGKLVGILSDHDVRRALALDNVEQITDPEQRIRLMEHFDAGRIMSKNVQTTTPTATLADASEQMIENRVGALPVIDSGRLVGIVTETDILHACVRHLDESP
jgi:CBS domain-containing protein